MFVERDIAAAREARRQAIDLWWLHAARMMRERAEALEHEEEGGDIWWPGASASEILAAMDRKYPVVYKPRTLTVTNQKTGAEYEIPAPGRDEALEQYIQSTVHAAQAARRDEAARGELEASRAVRHSPPPPWSGVRNRLRWLALHPDGESAGEMYPFCFTDWGPAGIASLLRAYRAEEDPNSHNALKCLYHATFAAEFAELAKQGLGGQRASRHLREHGVPTISQFVAAMRGEPMPETTWCATMWYRALAFAGIPCARSEQRRRFLRHWVSRVLWTVAPAASRPANADALNAEGVIPPLAMTAALDGRRTQAKRWTAGELGRALKWFPRHSLHTKAPGEYALALARARMAPAYLAGATLREIADTLNADAVLTPRQHEAMVFGRPIRKGRWTASMVRSLLQRLGLLRRLTCRGARPGAAPARRIIRRLREAGLSWRATAEALNRAGVPTRMQARAREMGRPPAEAGWSAGSALRLAA